MPAFGLFVDLDRRRVLIIGGGRIAAQKLRALEPFGPRLFVVSPELRLPVDLRRRLETQDRLVWRRKWFEPADLADMDMVIAATSDRALNRLAAAEAKKRGILCNVVDDPELTQFYFGSLITEGDLTVAISTNGTSPAAARELKARIRAALPEDIAASLAVMKVLRPLVRQVHPDQPKRAQILTGLARRLLESRAQPAPAQADTGTAASGDWDPDLYLRFERQRTQPARDLAMRAAGCRPQKVLDLGCGPGNSTAVLRQAFPEADITGLDCSPAMIERARQLHPELAFETGDARHLQGEYDLIFSNACLQWVPDHKGLIPELMAHLRKGGLLAVQVPANQEEPLFAIIDQVAKDPRWGFGEDVFAQDRVLGPGEYYDLLAGSSEEPEVWETVYCHPLESHEALLDWVRATRLRPYLAALDEEQRPVFEQEILERARQAYPVRADGKVLLRFRRLFFTTRRG